MWVIEDEAERGHNAGVLRGLTSNKYFDQRRFAGLLEKTFVRRPEPLLASTFAVLSLFDLARHQIELLGVDARTYYRAAMAFKAGTSPWDALVISPVGNDQHFAALPPAVLAFLPFTVVNEQTFVWLGLFLSAGAAIWIVRRLNLAWWWLMFPPLVEGVFSANPQIVLVAMLLAGSSVLGALAPILKIYAFAPLIGERRYRALVIAVALLGASWLVAPQLWSDYLGRAPEISERLMQESWGGYTAFPFYSHALLGVAIVGIVLLAIVDFRAAGWLAGPALVPASQFHLSTMALPVLARGAPTWLIVALAIPVRGVPPAAIGLYGLWRTYEFVRERRRAEMPDGEAATT